MHVGLLIARLVVGALLVGHGGQTLFGWLGGGGPEGTARFFEGLGYYPPMAMARAAGLSELTGGSLLILGLATPLGAAMILGVMLNAIVSVHWPNGLWATDNGVEYPLVMAAVMTMFGFVGAGSYSLDRVLDLPLAGIYSGVWTLIVGVGSAMFVLMLRRRRAVESQGIRERRAA